MKNKKLPTITAFILIFIVTCTVGYSLFTSVFQFDNTGTILIVPDPEIPSINALSGHWSDIQDAVDWIATFHGGVGDVFIPEGTFNFVEVGESWHTVSIPAGVRIFGAPTERDSNDQVVEWGTVLVMPAEAPDDSIWFRFLINGNNPLRVTDIKFVGFRFFDISSTTMYKAIQLYQPYTDYPTTGYIDFRIDHCHFQDLAGSAIDIDGESEYNRRVIRGVIDHNILVNTYGDPGFMHYDDRTLGYGIGMRRWASDLWPPLSEVVGHYTDSTIYIEHNYFSKWRHCVCSNDGFHYVFRNNIVEGDYADGSVDGHGSYADSYHNYAVGTRGIEIYNNIFRNPDTTWTSVPWAVNHRGGFGIIFNNTLEGYYALMDLNNDWGNYAPYRPDCAISDTYIWGNTLNGAIIIKYNADSELNEDYFLRAPSIAQDGWEYSPYTYPHPLTTGSTP